MNNSDKIRYLKHSEIDSEKWDNCIGEAGNSRVYAYHWHLDRTAVVWDALIYGDYEYVMPLPVRRKWGIRYVYQPVFCQQLGIFPAAPSSLQALFANELSNRFRFVQYQVNPQTHIGAFSQFEVTQKVNFILPLHDSYPTLYAQFKKRARNNIATARKKGIRVVKALDATTYVNMKKQQVEVDVEQESYKMLMKIISAGQTIGSGVILAAYTPDNEVCAAAFYLRSGTRIVYLNAFSTDEGKRNNAMYAIMDEFISENAGSGFLLDFEGSSLEGVAHFYRSFAPSEETYYQLYLNRLPFPLNLLKKNKG